MKIPIARDTLMGKNFHMSSSVIFCLSLCVGLYLFFSNPQLINFFTDADGQEPYIYFAAHIFEPNYSYISESILLPLLAKAVGATNSTYCYLIFCSVVTALILPNLALCAQSYYRNAIQTVSILVVFAFTYRYLHEFWLNFPDPLTIIFFTILSFQRQPRLIFMASVMAGLSHFSMAAMGIIACTSLTLSISADNKGLQHQRAKHMILGLMAAKIFLMVWFFTFEYKVESRLSIVLTKGIQSFVDRYQTNPVEFWLTPGIAFLAVYFLIVIYYLAVRQIKFALAIVLSISLAYLGLFFTTDGLRVFAVIIAGPYLIALRQVIAQIYPKVCQFSFSPLSRITQLFDQNPWQLACAGACSGLWLLLTFKAKAMGLLLNESTQIHIFNSDINCVNLYIGLTAILILIALTIPFLRKSTVFLELIKLAVTLAFALMLIQILRRNLLPSGELTLSIKSMGIALLIGIMLVSYKFKFLIFTQRQKPYFERLKRLLLN